MGFRMLLGLRNAGCFLTKSQEWPLPQPARDIWGTWKHGKKQGIIDFFYEALWKLYDFNNISRWCWSLIIALHSYNYSIECTLQYDLSFILASWLELKSYICHGNMESQLSKELEAVEVAPMLWVEFYNLWCGCCCRYSNRSFCFSCNLWQNYICHNYILPLCTLTTMLTNAPSDLVAVEPCLPSSYQGRNESWFGRWFPMTFRDIMILI